MSVRIIIDKEVYFCKQCPYYKEIQDFHACISMCDAIEKFEERFLSDKMTDRDLMSKVYEKCPFLKGEEE